ncbi:MAG: aspartate aminotransferase family protein [Flavobacteriaceae bacterium]
MKEAFYKYQAQTSPHPLAIEVKSADGMYMYDKDNKAYLDFVAGVSANTLGHRPPRVNQAIKDQLDQYAHVMVYGEFVQEPSVKLCELLISQLENTLDSVYLVNSGTEATEAALKLAKRVTGRTEMVGAKNAYHGNTMGSMSVCGNEEKKSKFRPLIPGSKFLRFNNFEDLELISCRTAGVILETIQGGAGFIVPDPNWIKAVAERCEAMGSFLILDEIQSGIGRTGKFFGYQHFDIVPDIIICGKGLGGGMPIGAMIASKSHMDKLMKDPKLGHITTFGGHPVIAAGALATVTQIIEDRLMQDIHRKEALIRQELKHPQIMEIRGKGLMLAPILQDADLANDVILECFEQGLILFWLLYEPRALRLSPPLNIPDSDIIKACSIIKKAIDKHYSARI